MAFEDFLDHHCDIYHLDEHSFSPNPALKASISHSYNDIPDIINQQCHFGVKNMSLAVNQTEPFNLLEGKIKLKLPFGVDVRLNDKIVECSTGMEFTAETPRHIRGHHTFVYIKRNDLQKPL